MYIITKDTPEAVFLIYCGYRPAGQSIVEGNIYYRFARDAVIDELRARFRRGEKMPINPKELLRIHTEVKKEQYNLKKKMYDATSTSDKNKS